VEQLDGLVPAVLTDAEQAELQQGVGDQVVVVPDLLLTETQQVGVRQYRDRSIRSR